MNGASLPQGTRCFGYDRFNHPLYEFTRSSVLTKCHKLDSLKDKMGGLPALGPHFPSEVRQGWFFLRSEGLSLAGFWGLAGIFSDFAYIGIATGAFIVTSGPLCACLCPDFPFLYRHSTSSTT